MERGTRRERGAAMVEYALLVALVSLVSLVSVHTFAGIVADELDTISEAMVRGDRGETAEGKTENPVEALISEPAAVTASLGNAATEITSCPNGSDLTAYTDDMAPKKNKKKDKSTSVDANGDGAVCVKESLGGGKGKTNKAKNIKDNNGP
jgi:Flp pilus assembly pilin Flp